MAQIYQVSRRKWRVRYHAGYDENGKRLVLHRTINGTKKQVEEWVDAVNRQRNNTGVVEGRLSLPSGDGYSWMYACRMLIPNYENCPIKVGFSTSIETRRQNLCGTGPFALEWIGQWKVNSKSDELLFHYTFKTHRLVGEWFFPHPDLLAAIEAHIHRQEQHDARN